jgi:hypothetical protein
MKPEERIMTISKQIKFSEGSSAARERSEAANEPPPQETMYPSEHQENNTTFQVEDHLFYFGVR